MEFDLDFIEWARSNDVFSDNVVYEDCFSEEGLLPLTGADERNCRSEADEECFSEADSSAEDPEVPAGDGLPDAGHEGQGIKFREVPNEGDRHTKPYVQLDPLRPADDPNIIGSFKLALAFKRVSLMGYAILTSVLAIIATKDGFDAACVPRGEKIEPMRRPRRDRMHPKNLQELADAGLLKGLVPQNLLGKDRWRERTDFLKRYGAVRFASLFTVPKSNKLNRVVCNGKPGNAVLNPPPYFRFFSPWDIVSRLIALGTFSAFTLDLKAWFYRIPMSQSMARFYAVAPGGPYQRFTCVPMGASIAPAIGQCATWALILYRERDDEDDLGVQVEKSSIPAIADIVRQGVVVGHIFVCLDNIAVVTKDPELTKLWRARLDRNAKALGVFPFKDEGRNQWTQAEFHYIGIHFANGKWRHDDDRVARWVERYGADVDRGRWMGPTIQRVVGVLVWDCRLRNRNTRRLRGAFLTQRNALSETSPSPPSTEQAAELASLWKDLLANEWQEVEAWEWPVMAKLGAPSRVFVTDASDTKWSWLEMRDGCVALSPSGTYVNPSGPFPTEVIDKIYYKEMYAILLVMRALVREGATDMIAVLVGDSRAAIGSLSKLLAPPGAWWMIDEVEEICRKQVIQIVLKWVESDGNVAHSATHDEPITAYRTKRSWTIASADEYVHPEGGRGRRDREGVLIAPSKREGTDLTSKSKRVKK